MITYFFCVHIQKLDQSWYVDGITSADRCVENVADLENLRQKIAAEASVPPSLVSFRSLSIVNSTK